LTVTTALRSPTDTSQVQPLLSLLSFVFFFEAEDGIRDKLVTGVPTCALPISCHCGRSSLPLPGVDRKPRGATMRQALHIFKKDFRYLMREVALMLVLSVALVWMATRGPGQALTTGTIELLLVAAACFLIA